MPKSVIAVTGNPDADALLVTDPLALVIGMLLDQQVTMESAFAAPYKLRERLGGHLDAHEIASMEPDAFLAVFSERPALHRFPKSMGARVQALCRHIDETYGGDAGAIWRGVRSGDELWRRVRGLPGYGDEKAQIFVALLAKRLGKTPPGWEQVAGVFADATPRSVADVDSAESLTRVREWKKAKKAAGKTKQD